MVSRLAFTAAASSFSPFVNVTSSRSVKVYCVASGEASQAVASHGEYPDPSGFCETRESVSNRVRVWAANCGPTCALWHWGSCCMS